MTEFLQRYFAHQNFFDLCIHEKQRLRQALNLLSNLLLTKIQLCSAPNITGSFKESGDEIGENGCFYSERTQTGWVDASDGGLKKKVFIDASRSSSAYGNASTVQPSSMQLLACIKS